MTTRAARLFAVTFTPATRGPVQLTLVDAADGAEVECALPQDPWEESADLSPAALEAFRSAIAGLPQAWTDGAPHDAANGLGVEVNVDEGGFRTRVASPEDLSPGQRAFLAAFVRAALATVEGARSRRAIAEIARTLALD